MFLAMEKIIAPPIMRLNSKEIENLRPYLKRMDDRESEQRDKVVTTAREWHVRNNLPKFEELLEVMRTGVVPAAESSHWKERKKQRIIEQPVFPEIERNG